MLDLLLRYLTPELVYLTLISGALFRAGLRAFRLMDKREPIRSSRTEMVISIWIMLWLAAGGAMFLAGVGRHTLLDFEVARVYGRACYFAVALGLYASIANEVRILERQRHAP